MKKSTLTSAMKHLFFKIFLSFLVYNLSLSFSFAQGNTDRYLIQNTNGSVTPTAITETNLLKAAHIKQPVADVFNGKYFRLIQFYDIPTDEQRKAWAKQGLTLTNYMSGNAYYAVIDNSFDLSQAKAQIRAILPVGNMFKKETKLYNRVATVASAKSVKLTVSYYKGLDANAVIDSLKKLGAAIQNHRDYSQQLDITIPESMIDQLSALSFIQYIGEAPGEPVLEGYNHRNSTGRTNYLNTNFNGVNYNGAGVVIGIGEGLIANNPIDVKGRFTEFVSGTDISSHKIGVIQNASGAGTLDPTNKNNAWGATVLSLPDSPDYAALFTSKHLLFTNHSYGSNPPIYGQYSQQAQDLDKLINADPLTMVIFSAGNSGTEAGFYSPYSGIANWANITAPIKHNKNQLAIGALDANDNVTDFSSRGPMYDGRIIPQLAVEGIEGTSDAAPKVTGMLAVLEQIYKSKNSNNEAPSTLLKAVLMNTADDLENSGPDFKTGYGRPNMRRAYNVLNNLQYLTGNVSNGNSNIHTIAVPANTKQVRVMIVWPDVAADVNATKAIVNDLDLVGTDPSSTSYLPWLLNSAAANLNDNAVRGADHLNTIEQITVDNPTSGNWNFTVSGTLVPQGSQTYYLVYEFLQDELAMAYPLKDERFESGQTYYLRWDSYGTSGTFDLSYELDGSGAWNTITTGIAATKRVYQWVAPTVTGIHSIKFKVTRGGTTSATSDVNYIGAVPQNLSVQLASGSTVNLYWTAVPGATAYKAYRLGANYMEEVTTGITFDEASATLTNQSTTDDEYYAVSAVTGANEGQRTMALKKSPGETVADPLTFTAAATSSTQINLAWTKNVINSDVMVAWSTSNTFGTPVNGTDYAVGDAITGGGTVLCKGNLAAFNHTGLTPYTTYYYKIWSKTSGFTYSTGVATYETTDCGTASTLPFQEDFTNVTTLPSCWKLRDNQGNGENWQFGTTSAGANTPSLTGNYAYINSYSSSNNLRNADLISPTFDLTNNSNIILSFKHQFIGAAADANTATLSYSIDNGISWTLLKNFDTTDNPTIYASATLTELQGKSQVKFKWTYTSTGWTFYWAIDDVKVIDASNYWTGATSTDWFTTTNWSTGAIPTATTAAIIPSAPANQPQINVAGAVCGDITIKSGASLTMNTSTAYTLSVSGDWTNNGIFNAGASTVDFNGTNALQTIAGTSTSTFNILSVTKGAQDRILEATGQITTATSVQITSGTFKLNNTASIVNLVSGLSISSTKGVWLNAGTINLLGTTYVWGGDLRISGGLLSAGSQKIYYNGGSVIIEGGQVNASAIRPYTTNTSTGTYNQSGGVVTITASSSEASRAPFDITSGSAFTMSGGTICIQKANTIFASDFQNIASTYNVTGGTLQIGDASTPVSQIIRINSTVPIYNLVVSSANAPTSQLVANGLTVKNDVTIGTNAKIDVNSLNLSVAGNWTNNGGGLGTASAGTVLFNGTTAQTLGGTSSTVFDNLTENNANGLVLDNDATVNGTLTLTSGVLATGTNMLIVGSAGSVSRTSGHVFGNLQKNVATGSSVNRTFEVGDAAELNYTPVTVNFASVTAAGNLVATTVSGDHTLIASSTLNAGKSVNRYWTLTNSGVGFTTYDGTFSFVTGDLDASANTSNLIAGKYTSSAWTYPTIGTKTATSIQLTGLTSFGDFALAEGFGKTSNGGNWSADATWSPAGVPVSIDNVLILSSGTVVVDVTNAVCQDLTIQNGAKLQIDPAKALTVSETITNNSDATGLIIKSDVTGTGSLIATFVSGQATAESYLTANAWHNVSPIASGGTVNSFIQNSANEIPSKDVSGTLNYGMMSYNETGNAWNSYYTAATADNLNAAQGYSLRRSTNGIVTYVGAISAGTKNISLTNSGEGWNCIGNPYTSAIKLNDATEAVNNFLATNATSLDASYACIYVWDDSYKGYKILGNSPAATTERILDQNIFQSGQGFFVKANADAAQITFNPAMQIHQADMQLKSGNISWPDFELTASLDNTKASTLIAFDSRMTKGLDPTYDAGLLRGSSGLELYTRLVDDNGVDFAVQCLPNNDFNKLVIPVGIDSKTGGSVVFSANVKNLPAGCSVILEDKVTNKFTDLASSSYQTSVEAGATGHSRFQIHTSYLTTGIKDGDLTGGRNLVAYSVGNTEIRIKGSVNDKAIATLYDNIGRTILTSNLVQGDLNIIHSQALKTGVYMLSVKDAGAVKVFKLLIKE